jgi:hypothetical protein
MLKVLGSIMYSVMTQVKKEVTLYAGAFLQFITGLMVIGSLCNCMSACNVGGIGLLM